MITFVRKNKIVFLVNILCFMVLGLALANMMMSAGIAMDERWLYEQYHAQNYRLHFFTLFTAFFAFIFNLVALVLSFKKQASN